VQGGNLTSSDGTTYLTLQSNGFLALINAPLAQQYPGSSAATLWTSANSAALPGPYAAVMQEVTPHACACCRP
jgi:hypothetical protein